MDVRRSAARRSGGRTQPAAPSVGPFALALLVAMAAVHLVVHGPVRTLALALSDSGAESALTLLSIVHLCIGLTLFLRAGGRTITPIGVYFLASALYFGYGGIAPAESKTTTQYLVYASVTALSFNVWVIALARRTTVRWRAPRSTPAVRPAARAESGGPLSVPLFVGLWLAFTLGVPLVRQVSFIGDYAELLQVAVSLLLLQAFLQNSLSDHPLRLMVGVPVFAAMSIGSYVFIFYTGYARIIFAGFLLAAAVLVGRRYRTLPTKAIAVALIAPAIAFAGANERTGLTFREAAAGIDEARGVTSMTGVLPVLGMTLDRHDSEGLDAYEHRGGRTFWVSSVHWVPREWWEEKPNGPEIELAQLLYPENPFGYSIVGSNVVEWILNFDLPGLVPGALVTGLVLGLVDRWARTGPRRTRELPHDAVVRALVTGNLVIFVWAGSFSFSARTFIGSVFLVVLGRGARFLRSARTDRVRTSSRR
jgi:hypothetical protein